MALSDIHEFLDANKRVLDWMQVATDMQPASKGTAIAAAAPVVLKELDNGATSQCVPMGLVFPQLQVRHLCFFQDALTRPKHAMVML